MSQLGRPNTRKRVKHADDEEGGVVIGRRNTRHESAAVTQPTTISGAATENRNSRSSSSSRSNTPPPRSQNDNDSGGGLERIKAKDTPQEGDEEDEEILVAPRDRLFNRNMVLHYGREALCLLAILLTTMASYQGTPKIGRPPTPRQFFPPESLVQDYPSGNLDAVSQQVSQSELSFVMYYAPWDAASQSARVPFGDVAQFYRREAQFSAINCWQPGGECRLQYSKIKAWPVLMAYLPKTGLGVLYNGPWERDPMMRFVASFLRPLKRLTDPDDLLSTLTSNDAIVVAFLDLQRDQKEWNVFYETAVRWMYRDPFQDIRFSVVTGESRSKFGVDAGEPVLRMYLWNETIEYDNKSWTTTTIENWVTKTVHRVTLWMSPSGFKSLSLSTFFKHGPVLVFFTPRNMLSESTDAEEMMRQLGMEYYNCNRDTWIQEMVREYFPAQRKEHQEELKQLRQDCQGFAIAARMSGGQGQHPVSVTFANLLNGSQFSASERIEDICQLESAGDSMFGELARNRGATGGEQCVRDGCTEGGTKGGSRFRETSMLRGDFDPRAPVNLAKQALRRKCELMHIDATSANEMAMPGSMSSSSFLGQKPFEADHLQGIEAMGCAGNKSLTMLLMDSNIYHVFAERLGVDILATKRKSAVFIIDPENESTYMLNANEDLTIKSIARFIRKFSEGSLRRHLRSTHLNYENTHFYTQPEGAASSSRKAQRKDIYLEELNAWNFAPKIAGLGPKKSLLVFFSSSNCAFCSMMSQHLLQIGNILRPLTQSGHLQIVRIDGDKNDLPWPFTVAEYPTLIFFAGSGDSRQFIVSERNSVALDKILGFTIANLNRPLRIYAIALTCKASRRSVKPLVNCLASLRDEINDAISVSLREWRRQSNSRARVLRRLQLLEAFYLETFQVKEGNQCASCDFNKLEGYCKRLVTVWGQ